MFPGVIGKEIHFLVYCIDTFKLSKVLTDNKSV